MTRITFTYANADGKVVQCVVEVGDEGLLPAVLEVIFSLYPIEIVIR